MSAHPTPHSSEDSHSIWTVGNVVLAVIVGGFALFWGLNLFYNAAMISAGYASRKAPVVAAAPAAPATAAVSALPPAEVTIKVNPANPLGYDTSEFTVKAGQTVKLTFNNSHPVPQPHNIVIGKVGTKEKLFAAAMQMAADPQGMTKGYIPETPDVLFHTKLLQPNTTETIEFTAPEAGQYPYLCTFPGHGAIMNGVMKVE